MPAINYELPRWIGQPADPAAHYQAGFQIGVHLGAQQAAQMFQQQQMAMQRQKDLMAAQQQEVENQYQMQVLNLKAAEMGRKHAANQEFRARVSAGEDPSQVLMQLAPELGESAASVLHTQAMRDQSQGLARYREANLQRMADAATGRDEIARAQIASREKIAGERETFSTKVDKLAKIQEAYDAAQASGDPETIQHAKTELDAARAFVPSNRTPGTEPELVVKDVPGIGKVLYMKGSRQIHMARPEPTKLAFKSKLLPQLIRDGMTMDKANDMSDQAWDKLAPSSGVTSTNTMTNAPSVTGKVKVRNPQGKVGLIPASQLDAALAEGYSKVE